MRGIAIALVVLCGSVAAWADEDVTRARAYFQAGVDAYDSGKYEDALRDFQQAHALSHNPALYFNMAACEEHLNHYQAAALLLRQYVIEKPDAEDRAKVDERIHGLEQRDESVKRPAPAVITEAPVTQPVATPAPPRKRLWSWVLLGATGLFGVGAISAGSYAVVNHDDLKSSCGATPAGCSQSQIDGLRSATVATDVLIGLTAAAAVTTVVLFIVEPKLGHKSDRAQVKLTPAGLTF
jgi:tetratricopeptide (TPR) repeat protein